ncbi:MAG TPA: hypothetical protein VGR81_14015 [Candidatus Acidoferrales bacterium]|nr:hypothetical protein [Candidatus Acidoferrales bacterium]
MKLGRRIFGFLMCLAMIPAAVRAQDQAKSSSEEVAKHLRVDFLLTEYNGEQKISSMPYTMYVEALPAGRGRQMGQLRMGVRVPISRGNDISYQDVGTGIDCTPLILADDSYDLLVNIDRSSVYATDNTQGKTDQILQAVGGYPVIRNFNAHFSLKLHDGETAEGTSATDPFNGHVLKVMVTLHVVK